MSRIPTCIRPYALGSGAVLALALLLPPSAGALQTSSIASLQLVAHVLPAARMDRIAGAAAGSPIVAASPGKWQDQLRAISLTVNTPYTVALRPVGKAGATVLLALGAGEAVPWEQVLARIAQSGIVLESGAATNWVLEVQLSGS